MSGRPSLILPWFENGSASEYLKLRNPSADRLRLVSDVILDVAEGLKYLHTYKPAPIVHGDLKGNNILITDDGHATLTDFGLSQVIEDLVGPTGITPSNTEAGPIRWQSPEFISDISETCRPQLPGDVWSFGCTAYELLTGNVPYYFRLRDPAIICDIQNGVKPPGVENDRLCGEGGIWKLLNDCWITDPTKRIQMTQVVPRLKELCSSSTVSESC
ncbi:kinase-like domain-containing protein [Rhodocollybia butyracea]|uniref:Kinase-like domain-containing protein n=1 Tax=Rhodocollybia butyracea TaxID=206335 RepID=A0A9P5PYM7_9AGAR|nr:kinase-like domain-containing protein [Rhodocollybia butyracea]